MYSSKGFTSATCKWRNLADDSNRHIRHHPPKGYGGAKSIIYKKLSNIRHFGAEYEINVIDVGGLRSKGRADAGRSGSEGPVGRLKKN